MNRAPYAIDAVRVMVGEMVIARLSRHRGGFRIQFSEDYLGAGMDLDPVVRKADSLHLERLKQLRGTVEVPALPALFMDSAPDRWGRDVLKASLYEKLKREGAKNPYPRACGLVEDELFLLSSMGRNGPGRMYFSPDSVDEDNGSPFDLAKIFMEERRVRLLASMHDDEQKPGRICALDRGWTIGGAQTKLTIGISDSGTPWLVGCGAAAMEARGYTPWLFKVGTVESEGRDEVTAAIDVSYGRIEYAYHKMATAAGVTMSESCLHEDGHSVGHFMTRRFDRGGERNLVYRSFCGLKNEDKGVRQDYATLWTLASRLIGDAGDAAADQFLRRMIFNVLSVNRDDHGRNHGFLYDLAKKQWEVAPAFDLMFNPSNRHHCRIMGRDNAVSRTHLESFATEHMKVRSRVATEAIDGVLTATQDWRLHAVGAGVQAPAIRAIEREIGSTRIHL